MNSPFASILLGQDRSLVIAENDHFIAVLEKRPLVLGHTILISKQKQDDFLELADAELSAAFPFAKTIAHAIRKVAPCRKIGIAVLGLETRHAHLHLVPITTANDLNFTQVKLTPSDSELQTMLSQIKTALNSL